jgi:hypothetical protein
LRVEIGEVERSVERVSNGCTESWRSCIICHRGIFAEGNGHERGEMVLTEKIYLLKNRLARQAHLCRFSASRTGPPKWLLKTRLR